jgi:V8-like Glu-specific endopeptidase
MRITLSYRLVAVAAGAAIVVGVQALIPPERASAAAPTGVDVLQAGVSTAAQAAAVRYWTPARMSAALHAADRESAAAKPATVKPATKEIVRRPAKSPAKSHPSRERALVKKAQPEPAQPWLTGDTGGQGLRWTHGGAVTQAVGKIFFTLDDVDYVCSGTLVGGPQADVVLTAAHCVTGGLESQNVTKWATNWMFAPDFSNGRMPYGEYTARRFFATHDWTGPQGGTEQYDVAFVQVTPAANGKSAPAPPPAGLPVKFAATQDTVPAEQAYLFGYPSQSPYTGQNLSYCAGPVAATGGSLRTACVMTAGDSGGPWLAPFSPRAGTGPVVAVCTYKVTDDLRVLYGAVLGPQARALYERAVSPAP